MVPSAGLEPAPPASSGPCLCRWATRAHERLPGVEPRSSPRQGDALAVELQPQRTAGGIRTRNLPSLNRSPLPVGPPRRWGCRIRTRLSEVKARRPAASRTPTSRAPRSRTGCLQLPRQAGCRLPHARSPTGISRRPGFSCHPLWSSQAAPTTGRRPSAIGRGQHGRQDSNLQAFGFGDRCATSCATPVCVKLFAGKASGTRKPPGPEAGRAASA